MPKKKFTDRDLKERAKIRQKLYGERTGHAAQKKYATKTYQQYTLNFRVDNDQTLIALIDQQKQTSKNISEIFREMLEFYKARKDKM